ncbi:MAG: hypothetical protein MJ078_01640, partial [Clostridia bacterium]|nr:hypothetical protein [Clostridia bacterium]
LDFRKHEDVMKQAKDVHIMWIKKVTDAARAIKPDVLVFFNAGDYPTGREDYVSVNDQLEAESLPTGGWGYDHFPMTMAYIRRKGKNCIGMTGKFHRSWGEFGGYKYKDALLYEGAQCVALNAGLSVGDQLHPTAKIDRYTYENIGNAVRYMKEREPWRGGDYIPEFAVFASSHSGRSGESRGRTGVCRMLFEEKYLFDLITYEEADLKKYPFLIMADEQYPLDETEYNALKDYIAKGGKLIASGKAPLYEGKIAFRLGAELLGDAPYSPSYIRPFYPGKVISDTPLVIYTPMYEINPVGKVLGEEVRPYFKRETIHFCSHNNIPCNYDSLHPAVTEGEDGFYIAAEIGTDYAKTGSLNPKQILIPLIEKLLPEKTVITNLPSSGKAVLYKKGDSYILHLLYANTVKRGEGVEVIEDLATIADIRVSLRLPTPVSAGVLRPEGTPLSLTEENGRVSFTLPKLRCSAIVELTEKK